MTSRISASDKRKRRNYSHIPSAPAVTSISNHPESCPANSAPSLSVPCSSGTPTSTANTRSSRPRGYPKPLGRGNGFPYTSKGAFLMHQSTSYIVHPSGKKKGRSYTIHDRHRHTLFRINPKHITVSNVKTLVQYHRNVAVPLVRMKQSVFSARNSITISTPDNEPLLMLQKTTIVNVNTGKSPVHGYIKEKTATKPQLVITSDSSPYNYVIRDRRSNEVARIVRFRTTKRSQRPKRYSYKVYISPGYDIVVFLMCVACLHEIWED